MLDDLNTKLPEPLPLKIEGGRFLAKGLFGLERVYFDAMCGDVYDIKEVPLHFRKGTYMYWRVSVKDDINTYWLYFPQLSAAFNDLVLKLSEARCLNGIEIRPYKAHKRPQDKKAPTRLQVYCHGRTVQPASVILPKIKDRRDYSDRLIAVRGIVANILQRAHGKVTPPKMIGGYLF